MSDHDRRTVRPTWVCGTEEQSVEHDGMGDIEEEANAQREQECGHRKTKRMLDPKLPSVEEVQQHMLTHLPYRSWCPHCVRGRGKEMDHKRKAQRDEPSVPEYHMDYCFPGDEDGQRLTVLVVVERDTRMKKRWWYLRRGRLGGMRRGW